MNLLSPMAEHAVRVYLCRARKQGGWNAEHAKTDRVTAVIEMPSPSPSAPQAEKNEGGRKEPRHRSVLELDGKDLQIIAALQINGRASFADLAEGIDLSQAAIRLRVKRLFESGVVEVVAITDPLRIGFTVQAMLGLKVDGDIETISEEIGAREFAVYVVMTAGRFDLLVEVLCADNDHLLGVINELRALDGVSSVETNTYLRLTKQTYAWGMPPGGRQHDDGDIGNGHGGESDGPQHHPNGGS
jgi:Lrp/AsnC family transcriptional regulator for asnA, asnC and gidA